MGSKLKNIDIEDYWNVINYNYGQIQFAEVKATAIISIYSLIFGLGYTLDILDEENIYSFSTGFSGIVHVLLLGVSFFFYNCIFEKMCNVYSTEV